MTEKQNKNCVWIGIGADIQEESELYCFIKKLDELLVGKYKAKKDFAGSEYLHLNLYDLSVPKENLKAISEKIKEIVRNQKSFVVKIRKVNYFSFGLFFLEVEKSNELENTHRKIVEEIVKLKGGCIDEDYLAPHRKYNERQKELLMKYGNPHVLDQFQPHITIGHVRNREDKLGAIRGELSRLIPLAKFKVDNVHIVVENKKGKKTLGKFNLIPME